MQTSPISPKPLINKQQTSSGAGPGSAGHGLPLLHRAVLRGEERGAALARVRRVPRAALLLAPQPPLVPRGEGPPAGLLPEGCENSDSEPHGIPYLGTGRGRHAMLSQVQCMRSSRKSFNKQAPQGSISDRIPVLPTRSDFPSWSRTRLS